MGVFMRLRCRGCSGEGLYIQRRWWGMVWIVGFYNGELYAGAGRGVFGVYNWVFKRRYYELDVGCGHPWRGCLCRVVFF